MKRLGRGRFDTFLILLGLLIAYLSLSGLFIDLSRASAASQRTSQELESLGLNRATSTAAVRQQPLPTISPTPPVPVVSDGLIPGSPLQIEAVLPPELSPTNVPAEPAEPVGIFIPAINLNAPILPADVIEMKVEGRVYQQWTAPNEFAAGWHPDSARLGEAGNTVINGHHNIFGEVFRDLVELEEGDEILIYSNDDVFKYQVANKMILPEKYEAIDIRMDNAVWILPSPDERVTLITCWPYESNTHRLIIVARPAP